MFVKENLCYLPCIKVGYVLLNTPCVDKFNLFLFVMVLPSSECVRFMARSRIILVQQSWLYMYTVTYLL